ncbi:MAG: T9SS type A sorting domain-containing protein [Saprospiraceae bacterium]|nr:T9SS type A sorting domain-containing protein [Saprospiraceae bacterium]
MKSGFISFFLFLLMSYQIQAQQEYHQHEYCSKALTAKKFYPFNHIRSSLLTADYDLTYYRFEWEIDPAVKAIKGTVTPYFKVLSDGFTEINFDFSRALIVDSIVFHGNKLAFSQPSSYILTIQLPGALTRQSIDSLSITYHGTPPSGGFGSFIQSSHGGEPILWTLSEPFGAQDWWPCKNGLDDKIDSIDILITTPEKYKAAGNGSLEVEKKLGNGWALYHWKHRYPITPYLVAFAVTNYESYTDEVVFFDGSTMPMLNFVYPENLNEAKTGTADNVAALQFFDSLFVAYPFKKEKYGHAQFGWGGGMEHQTMSFVSNFDWGLLAHELAHQWFGDFVTCGNWEDIWLNEGFATYLEGLTRERFESDFAWQNWKTAKVNSITSNNGGSVKVDNTSSVNRIFSGRLSYNKGSYLLHMLRWKLGDEMFFKGLRNYLTAHSYRYAVTENLQQHLENISGQSLQEFFDDWFKGQGFPNYKIIWDQEADRLLIKIEQTPSHESVSFFEMPVPVRLKGQGKEMMVRLENTENNQIFVVNPDFMVESVEFDPDLWLVAKSSVLQEDIILSGTESFEGSQISVYPNPTKDLLTVKMDINEYDSMEISIINTEGKKIITSPVISTSHNFQVAHLPSGIYYINVQQYGKQVFSSKFIKE